MSRRDEQIVHSEPVREIMGTPPRRIVAWGITLLFLLFLLFLAAAIYIRYPDTIPGRVEITTQNPPATLKARTSGRLEKIGLSEQQHVGRGDIVAVMESGADHGRVLELKSFLKNEFTMMETAPGELSEPLMLGEIQHSYTRFRRAYTSWYNNMKNDLLMLRVESLKKEVEAIWGYIGELEVKRRLLREDLEVEERNFRRDSLLHAGGVIADQEYERSYQLLINKRVDYQNIGLEIMSQRIIAERKQQERSEAEVARRDVFEEYESVALGAMYDLLADIDIWKRRYLLISPVDGVVTFTRFWGENQHVNEGEPVATIIPEEQGDYIGRVVLGMYNSGKVAEGMDVNIRLAGFPYLEYGMVRGRVKSKSLVPDDRHYIVEIELINGLTTLYGKELPFSQLMEGQADIVTDKLSLFTKIVSPVRHMLSSQRF